MVKLVDFGDIDSRIDTYYAHVISERFDDHPILSGIALTLIRLKWEGTPDILSDVFVESDNPCVSFAETLNRCGYTTHSEKITLTTKAIQTPAFVFFNDFEGIAIDCDNGDLRIYDFANDVVVNRHISTLLGADIESVSPYSRIFREPPPESSDKSNWIKHVFYKHAKDIKQLMLLSFFISVLGAIGPFFIMGVYNFALPSASHSSLYWLAIGAFTVALLEFGLKRVRLNILATSGKDLAVSISYHVTSKLLWLSYSLTANAGVASQIARLNDIDQFRKLVTADATLSYFDMPFIVIFLIAILLLSGIAAVTVVVGIVIMILFCIIARSVYQKAISENTRANALVSYQWNEVIINLASIHGLPVLRVLRAKFSSALEQNMNDSSRVTNLNGDIQTYGQMFIQLIGTSSIVIAVFAVLKGNTSPSSMIVIIILVWKVLTPVMGIYNSLIKFKTIENSAKQINALMSLNDDRERLEKSPPIDSLLGDYMVSGLSHRYPGNAAGLTNLEFKANKGEKLAIVGPSGSGKSTLLKILTGLEESYQGSVLLDGLNIRQFNNFRYRKSICHIPNDLYFFQLSIKENFNFYHGYMRKADMISILEAFNIYPYFDNDVNTILTPERLHTLPGGIKERLKLAIGLGDMRSQIIFIDEPLNGVADQFSGVFQHILSNQLQDKTIVITSNEKALIASFDKCLLLDNMGGQKYFGLPDKVLSIL